LSIFPLWWNRSSSFKMTLAVGCTTGVRFLAPPDRLLGLYIPLFCEWRELFLWK
jgi:hypothetical protein